MGKTFTKLTRPAMRALAAGEKIIEHGITFARLPNGDGVFTIAAMVDRQRIHRTVGKESDGTTRTQAEEYIEKLRVQAKEDRLALPKGRKVALSFRDAAAQYLKRIEESGGKDLKGKQQKLTLHLVPFFGDTPLSKIGSFDIERYKKQRLAEPTLRGGDRRSKTVRVQGSKPAALAKTAAPASVNRELAVLSHLFNQAVEWGWLQARPARVKRFKEDNGRIVYLTTEQVARLIEAAKTDGSTAIYPFIIVGLNTGMRLSEILRMRKEHVDVNRRRIHIPLAKAGMREQPITDDLADFLKGYVEGLPPGTPWLFPSPASKSGHLNDIRRPYRRVVAAAGLDPKQVIRHTLRHTAISHLVQAGVDLPTVKRISGHKTLSMVERYSHANGEHISQAMDKLQQRLKIA